jgi:enamine deaminase RidA (YjgF/YER057c/UK114 family)
MAIDQRLRDLSLELPEAPQPVGAYVPAVRAGRFVFTAGQVPLKDGKLLARGKVPEDVSPAEAQAAARQCVLNALAAVRAEAGSLEDVARVVRVNVFVASSPAFTGQADVANAASDLLVDIFGEAGRHTRCAIGAAALPLDAPVELDLIVQTHQPQDTRQPQR